MIPYDYDQYQWKSRTRYTDGTKRPFTPDKWMIHWGGNTNPGNHGTLADQIGYEMSILRGWQRYHIDTKGWTDIAYGYGVGNSGMTYRLRGENRSGAQSGDYDDDGIPENEEARAVVWIGGAGYQPTSEAYGAMARLITADLLPVWIHRDGKATQCPGDDWETWRDRQGWDTPTTPPYTPGEYKMRTIRYGAGSRATPDATVAAAQRAITLKGFFDDNTADGTCGADGIFRSGTEQQVKDFQQANGLVIDGICGDATWTAIDKE